MQNEIDLQDVPFLDQDKTEGRIWFNNVGLFCCSSILRCYSVLVMQNLWNWFLAPHLQSREMSYFGMWGIVLLANYLTVGPQEYRAIESNQRFKVLAAGLERLVGPERVQNWQATFRRIEYEKARETWVGLGLAFGGLTGSFVFGAFFH